MANKQTNPDFLFETSWEVCNKMGGIYTVLSTRAHVLQKKLNGNLLFIGPDIIENNTPDDFIEDPNLLKDWKEECSKNGLPIRIGRWNVPGTPNVVLVNYQSLFKDKNDFFFQMWKDFGLESQEAYGDYEESSIFAIGAAKIMESYYHFHNLEKQKVAAHFNEWMLSMGLLYLKKNTPSIATLFTTHATTVGRSIAGNNKPLYGEMSNYFGDQMASELNVKAKHNAEKIAAHEADCFTTVSKITAQESAQLLNKYPDCITPNGFESSFVPKGEEYSRKRKEAREQLLKVAENLIGKPFSDDTLLISTSGRYEYRNKGLDLCLDTIREFNNRPEKYDKEIVLFLLIPGWVKEARADLSYLMNQETRGKHALQHPFITHWLNNFDTDYLCISTKRLHYETLNNNKIHAILVPCYLAGHDGIFNKTYYDLLIGMDATLYPSYYEPWGYTPQESVAFGIPTITTTLAGFGLWAQEHTNTNSIKSGVTVIERNDNNYWEAIQQIVDQIDLLTKLKESDFKDIRKECYALAKQFDWNHFIEYYSSSYAIAFEHQHQRTEQREK